MDSINQQQPEQNKKDLISQEAINKIKELADEAKTCFFCTDITAGKPFATRPMSVQKVDDNGCLWFLSASDSGQNLQIAADPYVQLLFQGSHYSKFLNLYGKAEISKDKEKIKELWEPIVKTWFTGGQDDPRVTVIKITVQDGYYWDNKNGNVVAFAKQIVGAVTGQTLDDSIEGKIEI